jgi:hypothetical protein
MARFYRIFQRIGNGLLTNYWGLYFLAETMKSLIETKVRL